MGNEVCLCTRSSQPLKTTCKPGPDKSKGLVQQSKPLPESTPTIFPAQRGKLIRTLSLNLKLSNSRPAKKTQIVVPVNMLVSEYKAETQPVSQSRSVQKVSAPENNPGGIPGEKDSIVTCGVD